MTDYEKNLETLQQHFVKVVSYIESHDVNKITEEKRFELLDKLRSAHDKYLQYFEKHYDNLHHIKLTLFERRKDTLKERCKKTVEYLKYDYETDFIFAGNLDDEPRLDKTLRIGTRSSPSREKSFDARRQQITSNTSSNLHNFPEPQIVNPIMADFDIKIANQIIPDFDGNHKNVQDFIHKSTFYDSTLNNAGKALFLSFLINVKLLTKVRNIFNTEPNPANFNAFKTTILNRFSDKTTEEAKISQIEKLVQEGSVAGFATKIENLCAELVELKMIGQQNDARTVITNEVNKLGIRVFTRGLKRSEVRTAIIFKKPTTLTEAIKFALESDAMFHSESTETRINHFHFNNNNRSTNYNNPNRNNSSNSSRRFHNNNFRHQNNHNNNDRYNSNYSRNSNSNNNNSAYRYNNSNNNRNYNNNQRTFYNSNNNRHNYQNSRNNNNNYSGNSNNHQNNQNRNNNSYNNNNQRSQSQNNNLQNNNNYRSNSNSNHNNSQNYRNSGNNSGNSRNPQPVNRVARLGELETEN